MRDDGLVCTGIGAIIGRLSIPGARLGGDGGRLDGRALVLVQLFPRLEVGLCWRLLPRKLAQSGFRVFIQGEA